MNEDLQVLTAQMIHEQYGLDLSYAQRLLKLRRVPVLRVGKRLGTLRMDMENWLEKQGNFVRKDIDKRG